RSLHTRVVAAVEVVRDEGVGARIGGIELATGAHLQVAPCFVEDREIRVPPSVCESGLRTELEVPQVFGGEVTRFGRNAAQIETAGLVTSRQRTVERSIRSHGEVERELASRHPVAGIEIGRLGRAIPDTGITVARRTLLEPRTRRPGP